MPPNEFHETKEIPNLPVCICGRKVGWYVTYVSGPDDKDERWDGSYAECDCGMEYGWKPNKPHLVMKRRHRAAMNENSHTGEKEAP